MIFDYISALLGKWMGYVAIISFAAGMVGHFIGSKKYTRFIDKTVAGISIFFLFWAGFAAWEDLKRQLSFPNFDLKTGMISLGQMPTQGANSELLFIQAELINRKGPASGASGWKITKISSSGSILECIPIPNLSEKNNLAIGYLSGKIIASPREYLPELTMAPVQEGSAKAGWIWCALPENIKKINADMPFKLRIQYEDLLTGTAHETVLDIDKKFSDFPWTSQPQ